MDILKTISVRVAATLMLVGVMFSSIANGFTSFAYTLSNLLTLLFMLVFSAHAIEKKTPCLVAMGLLTIGFGSEMLIQSDAINQEDFTATLFGKFFDMLFVSGESTRIVDYARAMQEGNWGYQTVGCIGIISGLIVIVVFGHPKSKFIAASYAISQTVYSYMFYRLYMQDIYDSEYSNYSSVQSIFLIAFIILVFALGGDNKKRGTSPSYAMHSPSVQKQRPVNSSDNAKYDKLKDLKRLKDAGILTDEEFNNEKSKILNQ